MKRMTLALGVTCLLAAPAVAFAQDRHHPPPPPPEAFEACADLEDGARCQVDTPHGTINGTCRTLEDRLWCIPDHPPPPPEAFEACADLNEGDSCEVETPRGTMEGTCRAPRDRLLCVPNGPPPPPPRR